MSRKKHRSSAPKQDIPADTYFAKKQKRLNILDLVLLILTLGIELALKLSGTLSHLSPDGAALMYFFSAIIACICLGIAKYSEFLYKLQKQLPKDTVLQSDK